MSLVERAKEISVKKSQPVTREELDLALAWIRGEVRATQAAQVLGIGITGMTGRVGSLVVRGIRQGLMRVEVL